MARLGIDLGTSNSAAALWREGAKEAVMVEPAEGPVNGAFVFPSYIAFDPQGEVMAAGLWARERYREGAFVVCHFKRLMGRSYDYVLKEIKDGKRFFQEFQGIITRGPSGEVLIRAGAKTYSPSEIAAFLLKKIMLDAQAMEQRQWGEGIEDVTISVPAGWEDEQRKAIQKAAELANLPEIKVIEEPTAAAIALGVETGTMGKIAVLDIGAGTTDIVVGFMIRNKDSLSLNMSIRKCDDLLGGMDMDELIRNYLLEHDNSFPPLRDIYPQLEREERNRLMFRIEEAKIQAALDGNAPISISLRLDNGKPKRVSHNLTEKSLNDIVKSSIYGYVDSNGRIKGLKTLIESALLELDPDKSGEVKKEIQQLILVGGPARMRTVHNMLQEVFNENEAICQYLKEVDPDDNFFMESVAKGAALSALAETKTLTPYPISLFNWKKGKTLVIPQGMPYSRTKGIVKSARVSVDIGLNLFHIISERDKEQQPLRQISMKSHDFQVPESGELEVTLYWDEAGTGKSKSSIRGAGLPGIIDFPEVKEMTTIGELVESTFHYTLKTIKDLRATIYTTRPKIRSKMLNDFYNKLGRQLNPSHGIDKKKLEELIDQEVDKLTTLSEDELRLCEKINPDAVVEFTDEEVELVLKKGYFAFREKKLSEKYGISTRTIDVLDLTYRVLREEPDSKIGDITTLIEFSDILLKFFCEHAEKSDQSKQFLRWLSATKKNPSFQNGCMLVNAMLALGKELKNAELIDDKLYELILTMHYKFNPKT